MNENQLRVYDTTAGTPISDPDHLLDRAEQIKFSTGYPGGIFLDCSFFIPCDPLRYSPIDHAQRIQVKNGSTTIWEGFITSIAIVIMPDRIGLDVQATGYWGLAYQRYKYNRWIDRRFQADTYGGWATLATSTGVDNKFEVEQTDKILIKPKQVQFGNGDNVYIAWYADGSSANKRIKFSYALSTTAEINPVRAKKYTAIGTTYSANLPNMIDGNSGSSQTVSLATSDYLYIGFNDPASVTGLRFDFGATVNANAATLTIEYSDLAAGWTALAITDNTVTAGAPWAKDGTITWTTIDGWDTATVNGTQKFYYLRISTSATLTANVVINDVYIQRAQSWTIFLNDLTAATTLWSTATAGTGTQDLTLAPTSGYVAFGLTSNASQAVTGNGIYGQITDLSLVAESWDGTAKTTVHDMLTDMVHYLSTPFKDDYTFIAANAYDMLSTGFVSDSLDQSLGDDMTRLGQFSATDEPYSIGCIESDAVSGTNTSPIVYYEKVPALTDYEYAVRLDEQTLDGVELVTSSDLGTLINRVFVRFSTPNNQKDWANVNDYAGLDSTSSQSKYYMRVKVVDGEQAATKALAAPYGGVYINAQSGLAYYMRSPLTLRGTIRKKDGSSFSAVPVSHIRAGERIKIENFVTDVGDVAASGLTFLISHTDYDDDNGTMSVTCTTPDDLALQLAQKK